MDASGAPVTDELTGVHHGPQRDAIYEPEKTARRRAHRAAPPPACCTPKHHVRLHNFTQHCGNCLWAAETLRSAKTI